MRRLGFAAIGAALAASALIAPPVSAGEAAPWRAVDAETGQIRDIAGLEQLAQDFPDSGSVRLRALQPLLAAGEVEEVMETLEWLYDRGYVFSEVAQTQIPKLLEGVDPGRIAERLRAEAEVVEASEVVWTVPAEARLVESVLRDPAFGRLIITTVNSREAIVEGNEGQIVRLSLDDPDNLSGVVATPDGKHIWVASGNIDGSEGSAGRFRGLLSLRPGTGERARVTAPDGVNPSDLAVGPDGTFYASDPLGGGVYRAGPTDETLQTLVAPGTLRSPQGLAVSEDGNSLYVSDYRYGIAIVDLATGKVGRLATDLPILLDGFDGLWRHGDELIGVQNGTSPMKIAALKLDEAGTRVIGHRVLEQAHTKWTEPLSGSISDGALYYVGNGQWDRYVQGEPAQDKPPLPTDIRRLPLDPN